MSNDYNPTEKTAHLGRIRNLENRVKELEAENATLLNFYNSQCGGKKKCGHDFSCICAGDAVRLQLSCKALAKESSCE